MKIKKVRTIADIKRHPAVQGVDSEIQFGEKMYFINLKDGFKNRDDDVHQLNSLEHEVVAEFNDLITTCDCEECKPTKMIKKEKLYFVVDKSFARGNQVYSGHSGTGKKFQIHMSDYGKYAMKPSTKEGCDKLIKRIEKDAKGTVSFEWKLVPMTQIDLCNFYEDTSWNQNAYEKLKQEQLKIK